MEKYFFVTLIYCGLVSISSCLALEKVSFVHGDQLGSVSIITDQTGGVVSQQSYYPYGNIKYQNAKSKEEITEKGYTGQVSDQKQTDLYYYNARYYNPTLAKFTQADTINDQLNRYAYVGNDPVNMNDPSGNMADEGDDGGANNFPEYTWNIDQPSPENAVTVLVEDYMARMNYFGSMVLSDNNKKGYIPETLVFEWLTGIGPRNRYFGSGDHMTNVLRRHWWINDFRIEIAQRLVENPGVLWSSVQSYSLAGIKGVDNYICDLLSDQTSGRLNNSVVAVLGSYSIRVAVIDIDENNRQAVVSFHVWNASTLGSALHLPIIGYFRSWQRTIDPALNKSVSTGPGSKTTQDFWWTETISY